MKDLLIYRAFILFISGAYGCYLNNSTHITEENGSLSFRITFDGPTRGGIFFGVTWVNCSRQAAPSSR